MPRNWKEEADVRQRIADQQQRERLENAIKDAQVRCAELAQRVVDAAAQLELPLQFIGPAQHNRRSRIMGCLVMILHFSVETAETPEVWDKIDALVDLEIGGLYKQLPTRYRGCLILNFQVHV